MTYVLSGLQYQLPNSNSFSSTSDYKTMALRLFRLCLLVKKYTLYCNQVYVCGVGQNYDSQSPVQIGLVDLYIAAFLLAELV